MKTSHVPRVQRAMVTALVVASILIFPISAMCGPYLVCDSQNGVTHYKITGDAYWTSNVPAQADGSIKSDLQGVSTGAHNINVAACKADAVWGELCSSTTPFSFTRPAGPSVPSDLAIVAQ